MSPASDEELRYCTEGIHEAKAAFLDHLAGCPQCRTIEPCAEGKSLKGRLRLAEEEFGRAYEAYEQDMTLEELAEAEEWRKEYEAEIEAQNEDEEEGFDDS